MHLKAAAIAAILVTAGLPAANSAEPGFSGEEVRFAPAATPAQTHEEIRRAAWRMCREQYVPSGTNRKALTECVAATVDDAVAQSDRPALRRHHAALKPAERYAAPS